LINFVQNLKSSKAMSVADLKNNLHRLVVNTDNERVLEDVHAYFIELAGHGDWWDKLTIEQQEMIKEGEKQALSGRLKPHHLVRERVGKLLSEQK
jgi:hypothetical protein